ncbi:MAG: T9SS type A sorting domain-containing protein [Ignavibacteriaceae bacterium]
MKRSILLILFVMSISVSFGQTYQGPASGSVTSGVQVNTATFTEEYTPPKTFKPKPLRNLFTRSHIADSENMPHSSGEAGSNYITDPNATNRPGLTGGDFVLTKNFQGIPDQGWFIPPDPYMAVGPTHIMTVVNSRFRISDKSGTTVSTIEGSTWYNSTLTGADPFDPKVIYDHFAKRWIMVWLNVNSSSTVAYFLVSVSDDSIPTGTWYNWKIPSNVNGSSASGDWADYQGVGYDNNAIYLTSNQFTPAGAFNYSKIRILRKSDLLANTAGALNWTDLWDIRDASGNVNFGIRPTRSFTNQNECYFIARSPYVTGTYFSLYKMTNPATSPAMTVVNVPVTAYSDPDDAKQMGSSYTIDGGGSELRNEAVYRDGKIYFVHAVKSGTGGLSSAVRYIVINTSNNTVAEDKAMGIDGYFHTYPSLEVDGQGNIVMTYTRTSSTEYAGAYYTTKPVTSSTPTGSKLLKTGAGSYYKTFGGARNRWGDYNGAWLDPSNSSKIWVFTEYVASTNTWGTWTGELTFQTDASFVTVSAPDGGENWQVGTTKNITWSSSNVTNVKIEYSTNSGTSWTTIAASVQASLATYTWTVPSTPSATCLVRISDAANSTISDVSNSVFTISTSGLGWESVVTGTTGDIWSIDYVNAQVVWILASNGEVKKSVDGGTTWTAAGNVGEDAYSIAALSDQIAIVATGPASGNGKIFKTINGGTNWVQKYTVTGAWFNSVDNISATELWAVSDPIGSVFHIVASTDAGETWVLTSNRPSQPATNVYGANGSFYRIGNTLWFGTGGATGATLANRVYKSTNGYNGPWTFATTSAQFVGTIAFNAPNGNGLAGFWQGDNVLNKTSDGGASFTAFAPTIGTTQGIDFIQNTTFCWAATTTGLWKSIDNGNTWSAELIPSGITAGLNTVKFYNDANIGLAGGNAGVLLKSKLSSIIPVELTSFSATIVDQTINLKWSTASETNNRGFEIQKKTNETWSSIGFVSGYGTTASGVDYNFVESYKDNNFSGKVVYRLKQLDYDGKFTFSNEVEVDADFTAREFSLSQNYPNPFNPSTVIAYSIPFKANIILKVYDNLGREVATLVEESKETGKYEVEFNASKLASGVYFYKLQAGNYVSTKKFVLMK